MQTQNFPSTKPLTGPELLAALNEIRDYMDANDLKLITSFFEGWLSSELADVSGKDRANAFHTYQSILDMASLVVTRSDHSTFLPVLPSKSDLNSVKKANRTFDVEA